MQTITPFLWFDGRAEEAMNFYVSVFENSKIVSTSPGPQGSLMSATVQLNGREFILFNGGPHFTFNEAISLFVDCGSQAEADRLWDALTADGQPGRCGWLKDKFGVSWQIVPPGLIRMLGDPDPAKARRATEAMLQMSRIDIAAIQRAVEG